jgi:hypothetical protein
MAPRETLVFRASKAQQVIRDEMVPWDTLAQEDKMAQLAKQAPRVIQVLQG